MASRAQQIIEELAALIEAPVEEPVVEPEIDVPTERPSAPPPQRERRPAPWRIPPDMEPDTFPRPKAEDQEAHQIERWLQVTQQPLDDWEWDGQTLTLMLRDGNVETYDRRQLEEIGILSQAFAESKE